MHSLWLHCVEKLLLSPTKAETGVTSSASRDGRRWRTDPATWEGLIEKEKCVSKNSSLTQQISLLGRPDAASARSDGVYMYKEIPQLVWVNSLTGGGWAALLTQLQKASTTRQQVPQAGLRFPPPGEDSHFRKHLMASTLIFCAARDKGCHRCAYNLDIIFFFQII